MTQRRKEIRRIAQDLVYDGWDALESGAITQAKELFQQAIKIDANIADAYNGLACILYDSGKLKEAKLTYEVAYEKAKEELGTDSVDAFNWWANIDTRPYMRARHGLGLVFWRLGKYDKAIAEFKAILERNPNDNQGVRYLIAPLFQLKGDLSGALREYEQFEKDYSGDVWEPHYCFNWGLALFTHRRIKRAVVIMRRAFFGNLYIAPLLLGRKVKPHPIWHGINIAKIDYAREYILLYQQLWESQTDALIFLQQLWDAPEIKADIHEFIEIGVRLNTEPVGVTRSALVEKQSKLREKAPSHTLIIRLKELFK